MARPYKHPKTGVYWLRLRVPADIKSSMGKAEVKRSLRTKDPDEAKGRFPDALKAVQAEFQRHREGPVMLSTREISGLAGEHYRELVALGGRVEDAGVWQAMIEAKERATDNPAERLRRWAPTAEPLLAKAGLLPDEDSRQRLAHALVDATIRAAAVAKLMVEGDFSPDPNFARFAPMPTPKGSGACPTPEASKVTLTGLRELWEREHKAAGGPEETRKSWANVLADFTRFLKGSGKEHLVEDAASIAPKDVTDYADHLRHVRGLRATSINGTYLGSLRAIFGVRVTKHKLEINPAKGVSVSADKVTKTRPKGFTDEEAKAILTAALAQKDPMRRWVPWIAAYTGCRVGEIGQLRRKDFMEEGGVPFFRVTPEAGSVKTGTYRDVPIHPHLVELGLLAYAEKARNGVLFPVKNPEQAVRRFVRGVLKLSEGYTLQPNHAWRHRLKTQGRLVGMDLATLDAIQGHAPKTEGEKYGEWPVAALYRELTKLPRYEVSEGGESSAVSAMDGDTGRSDAVED